jgi:hypothetical protein
MTGFVVTKWTEPSSDIHTLHTYIHNPYIHTHINIHKHTHTNTHTYRSSSFTAMHYTAADQTFEDIN